MMASALLAKQGASAAGGVRPSRVAARPLQVHAAGLRQTAPCPHRLPNGVSSGSGSSWSLRAATLEGACRLRVRLMRGVYCTSDGSVRFLLRGCEPRPPLVSIMFCSGVQFVLLPAPGSPPPPFLLSLPFTLQL